MKIAFFLNILNHHQVNVADELYKQTNGSYCFVELDGMQGGGSTKGGMDFSDRPYLLQAWKSEENRLKAMEIALNSEACVFGTTSALLYQRARLKKGLLSFEVSERWLKRGLINIFSPRLIKILWHYYTEGWNKKPLYKLCSSAFAAEDQYKLGTFRNKCFKWGYFTKLETNECDTNVEVTTSVSTSDNVSLMWCSRYLKWKHPELPILMAKKMIDKGYKFHLDMYGTGDYEDTAKSLAENLKLMNVVSFHGAVPNDKVHEAMRNAEIFLFTSDRHEGWGAVANESLSEGCVLVASDAIGSAPYLIDESVNGFLFHSSKIGCSFNNPDESALESLCEKVERIIDDPKKLKKIQQNAVETMHEVWSPRNAAASLMQLVNDLKNGKESSIKEGPCSKA